MKLVSDFTELYDIYFSGTGLPFNRLTTQGPNKKEQFKLLQDLGLKIPAIGLMKELSWNHDMLVCYENQSLHCGEGKILFNQWDISDEDFNKYGDYLCSEYIGLWPCEQGSYSLRILNIGLRQFLIEYKSNKDWRSNRGEGTVKCVGETKKWLYLQEKIDRPLWAIDFVMSPIDKQWYAVDYNESPGVKGIEGLSDYILHIEIANQIQDYLNLREN